LGCTGREGSRPRPSLTVDEAKAECLATPDCDGFFHYNSTGKDNSFGIAVISLCFKKLKKLNKWNII